MNPFELLIALVAVAGAFFLVRRMRRSGADNLSTTNVLLAVLICMGGFGFYLYTEAENREALRTRDMERCWHIFNGSECSSRIAAEAAKSLSRGY